MYPILALHPTCWTFSFAPKNISLILRNRNLPWRIWKLIWKKSYWKHQEYFLTFENTLPVGCRFYTAQIIINFKFYNQNVGIIVTVLRSILAILSLTLRVYYVSHGSFNPPSYIFSQWYHKKHLEILTTIWYRRYAI